MSDHFALAEELARKGEPFVVATVVRAESPTSAKAGDKAIITQRGLIDGWVGGSCAEPTVLTEAKAALEDGECRLIRISPTADASAPPGMKLYPMTCYSGGTLEIYIEPHVSLPLLLVFGNSPVARALSELGRVMNYRVTNVDLTERPPLPGNAIKDLEQLEQLGPGPVYAVVATHGMFDEQALARAVALRPHYLGLVASPRRAAGVKRTLLAQGVDARDLEQLRTPAGVEIGARTAEEIALSILAEIVKVRRQSEALPARARAGQTPAPRAETAPLVAAPAHDCCAHEAVVEPTKPGTRVARPRISAILLAAGESRRMGGVNKLLLPIDGVTLVRRTAETLLASGIEDVVAVLGFEADQVERALSGLPIRFVVNNAFQEGQETSVRTGLAAVQPGSEGVMICLGDQPALRPEDIREIERAFLERKRGSVLVPMYRGTRGNPIVLDRYGLDQILARGGKFGCRQLTTHHADLVEPYEMSNDHVLKDIDRPEDYAAL
jgi:xanthine dehydrogenase accessory factor